jgi:hypothetical protein
VSITVAAAGKDPAYLSPVTSVWRLAIMALSEVIIRDQSSIQPGIPLFKKRAKPRGDAGVILW